MLKIQGKYIVTVKGGVVSPNGKAYRSIWGNVMEAENLILGKVLVVGGINDNVIVGQDQIVSVVRCENEPSERKDAEFILKVGV